MSVTVTLREKVISKGTMLSLYLDYYPGIPGKFHPKTGNPMRREFLELYLHVNPETPGQKLHNKVTEEAAELKKVTRRNEVKKPEVYTRFEEEQLRIQEIGKGSFNDYFQRLAEKRSGNSREGWDVTIKYFKEHAKEYAKQNPRHNMGQDVRFADLTQAFCNSFKDYLLTEKSIRTNKARISTNSASVYFSKFKAALRQAYKDEFIQVDMSMKIQPIKMVKTTRNFLTLEEVNALIQTPCDDQVFKRAAIFAAFTGIRHGDIKALKWGNVSMCEGAGYVVSFTVQKTGRAEIMPISDDVYNLLGPRMDDNAQVFEGLYYSAYHNVHLTKWLLLAGITKKITFHCFRHTFATLQLSMGTDIYTVKEMLGHTDIKTTQIYAKILDETKRTAANKIQLNVSNWK
jgi:integrase